MIPNDKFISTAIEKEAKFFSTAGELLDAVVGEKIIAIKHEGKIGYKWDSIHPNIHMANRLIGCVDSGLHKGIVESLTYVIPAKKTVNKIEQYTTAPVPPIINAAPITRIVQTVPETLREYQTDGIKRIFNKWRENKRSVLFQMPTGTGKTVLFNEIAHKGNNQNKKILIVVHRKELIDQITRKLENKGITVGHIVAGKEADYTKNVQVASIQTFARRDKYPDANLIIIDECHHAKAATYKKLWNIYKEAKFLGVTATPWRLSGEGFDDLFDDLIVSMSINQFIEAKHLVPITHYVGATPNLSKVKQRQGDYETKMLSDVMLDNSVMSDLVESYQDKCAGKSTIVFAVDVEHSKEIALRYKKAGISAEHIDSSTHPNERDRILNDFKSGKIKVVSNVEIITEGFDFPECEAVQLARPTKSLSLYLQMVGRVMRPAKDKKEGIVLDNAGLWLEHSLCTIDREWSLKARKKKKGAIQNQIDIVAIDKDGVLREASRQSPAEIKGLKLISLTPVLKRLLYFETLVSKAKNMNYKLHTAYFEYKDYIEEGGNPMSLDEFEYIKNRLASLSQFVEPDKAIKSGFWYHKEIEIKAAIADKNKEKDVELKAKYETGLFQTNKINRGTIPHNNLNKELRIEDLHSIAMFKKLDFYGGNGSWYKDPEYKGANSLPIVVKYGLHRLEEFTSGKEALKFCAQLSCAYALFQGNELIISFIE